ncbi:MAG: tetratricopeptide repeat protein [Saprospiraceae bacterium]
MNRITLFVLILIMVSCRTAKVDTTNENLTSNEELKAIYKADQGDRQSGDIDWSLVSKRDEERKKRVYKLLDADSVTTSEDYYHAAMIFQHGGDTISSGMAVKMMRKAIDLDSNRSKWLLAAAIDRDLMRRGKPQIYGTQYQKRGADAPWILYDLDTTQITDAERREYGVETLAEQREKVKRMNKKSVNELLALSENIDEVITFIKNADLKNSEYNLSEGGINSFGYELMREGRDKDALKIFKLNTELYPKGYNTHDSYGECLVKIGKTKEGITAYKKSLELNPKNEHARKVIAELEK